MFMFRAPTEATTEVTIFDIEHHTGDRAVARQTCVATLLSDVLTHARKAAAKLGADHFTITDARGDFVGVFHAASC